MDCTGSRSREAYREFRAQIIDELGVHRRERNYYGEERHPFRVLRDQIVRLRKHLVNTYERMLASDAETEFFVRKVLRIPQDVPLIPTRSAVCMQCLWFIAPSAWSARRARRLLRDVGSHEGRSLLYELQIKKTLPGDYSFTDSFDFALRRLDFSKNSDVVRAVVYVDIGWMRALEKLGASTIEQVVSIRREEWSRKTNGTLVLALVELGVIDSIETLHELPTRDRWHVADEELSSRDVQKFRQVAKKLRDAAVAPIHILQIVQYPLHRLDPQRLEETLRVINLQGAALSRLFSAAGEQILSEEPARWAFLRDVLGVHSDTDLARFVPLLRSGREPSREFALALRAAGATVEDLEVCQKLILTVGERATRATPMAELHHILEKPYSFSFQQLAGAEGYLLGDGDLEGFLGELASQGYGKADDVLEFQRSYTALSTPMLHRWLNVAKGLGVSQKTKSVADWVANAGSAGHLDAFEYLRSSGELQAFDHLTQALKVVALGRPMLEYLREARGLTSVFMLKKYWNEIPGIRDVRLWGTLDVVSRVLLDDAFVRNDFRQFEGNRSSVRELIDRRTQDVLGPFPFHSDDFAKEKYRAEDNQLRDRLRHELAPRLGELLKETDGVLPLSLLVHIDEPIEQLRGRLSAFGPLLADLLSGGGPTGAALGELEADLVSLVYRTTPGDVIRYWPEIHGRQHDIAPSVGGRRYSMRWSCTESQLRGGIDQRGLRALLHAREFAKQFGMHWRDDMARACLHLKSKRLRDPAADVWSLAPHLGVMLAIAQNDSNVATWLAQADGNFEELIESGGGDSLSVESLHDFFNVQLKDALDTLNSRFVDHLTDEMAYELTARLIGKHSKIGASAKETVREALSLARDVVLKCYLRWTSDQKKRIAPKSIDGAFSELHAVVSKSPSAFFAKMAVGLCTRTNTAMWKEPRCAHLLVFAPGAKQLAGMALVYFEKIPSLSRDVDTLVIRAINPTVEALRSHSVDSIVDAYFDVAIRIAKDNRLAAVAFPSPIGMHLMSNRSGVEEDIRTRYMQHATSHWGGRSGSEGSWLAKPRRVTGTFYAYEAGQAEVSDLYAIWHASELPVHNAKVDSGMLCEQQIV